MSQNPKIQIINDKSPYLEQVIALGDRNTKTLGFIAEGAFPKFAANDQIIGAIIHDIGCIGYILYRKVARYNRISITHLCIDESYRGQGIAKKLLDKLISMTKAEFRGIFLTCRNDYGIDSMWSRLGFTPQNYRPAKTKGKELTDWWYPYDGDQNLFDYGIQQQLQSKLCVIIDPNIFFYFSQNESIKSAELESLRADWLQTELELCLNDGIYPIINNIKERGKKNKYINFVPGYQLLKTYDYSRIEVFFNALKKILPDTIEQDKIMYIAKTIASDISIFITDDEQLLSNYDYIYKEFHLEIITPNKLINRLDELRTKPSYQPDRLAGTSLQKVSSDTIDQDELTIFYDEQKTQETKAQFKQRLASFLLDKNRFESFVILGNNQLLALLVYARHKQDELEIVMFRMIAHELSSTLASHLIFYSLSVAIKEKRQFTKITDIYLGEIVNKAIEAEFGRFVKIQNQWLNLNVPLVLTGSQLSLHLNNISEKLGDEYNFCSQISRDINNAKNLHNPQYVSSIESFLYPVKIIDGNIPTFVIPIKPKWAKDLFDENLANQLLPLFQDKTELAINRENVYYTKKLKGLKAPARILWYVSDDSGYYYVKSIRSCSRLEEIIIDKPQELYERFRRFGVYNQKDLLDLAKSPDNDIIALRFSDTELFDQPIPLSKIQEIMENKNTMQSSFSITAEQFAKLYNLGNPNRQV